jgi:hypothetical protein
MEEVIFPSSGQHQPGLTSPFCRPPDDGALGLESALIFTAISSFSFEFSCPFHEVFCEFLRFSTSSITNRCHNSNAFSFHRPLITFSFPTIHKQMPPSVQSRQPKRKRATSEETDDEHLEPVHNDTPKKAENSEYMTCTCGSIIKKIYFWRHFHTRKHLDYLVPVLIREDKERVAQREKEQC